MSAQESFYIFTLHPDKGAAETLRRCSDGGLTDPLWPHITLFKSRERILFPLSSPIKAPPAPLVFDSLIQENGQTFLIPENEFFLQWRSELSFQSEPGFPVGTETVLNEPIQVNDWRGGIHRIELTREKGLLIRYRWDTLNSFHLTM